jgi:hypothetical protein
VGYDCEIRIFALRHLGRQFYLQPLLLVVILIHCRKVILGFEVAKVSKKGGTNKIFACFSWQ